MKWFSLHARVIDPSALSDKLRSALAGIEYHDEVCVGAHFKLTGIDKAAHLETRDLAERYLEACEGVFAKRYGADAIELTIGAVTLATRAVGGETRKRETARQRVEEDTRIVQARLDQGVFAPNKRPKL